MVDFASQQGIVNASGDETQNVLTQKLAAINTGCLLYTSERVKPILATKASHQTRSIAADPVKNSVPTEESRTSQCDQ